MGFDGRMEFGLFLPPQHYPRQNPTRALRRDLETIEFAERMGFVEAWIGEHHSSGYEIVGAPEVFVAAAIERTKRIKIGTGVVSLPYHHPYHVATRAVLLDHLSEGRTMLGVGPGSLPTDGAMLAIPWSETRSRMVESWEAIYHLLTSQEPLTVDADWFAMDEAVLQLRPFTRPTPPLAFTAMESPFGPALAGQYGGGLISLSATSASGYAALGRHWSVVEESAEKHGQQVSREDWRVVTMLHIAETREQAKKEVQRDLPKYAFYSGNVSERTFEWLGGGELDPDAPKPPPPTVDELIEGFGGTKIACIGTPEDAIEMIQGLVDATGGFGKVLLLLGSDWVAQDALERGLELFAREVMPAFQDSSTSLVSSMDRVMATRVERVSEQRASINEANKSYSDDKVA
jgi:limonene 1,2-monooxygenase